MYDSVSLGGKLSILAYSCQLKDGFLLGGSVQMLLRPVSPCSQLNF